MRQGDRNAIVRWVSDYVLPHEGAVRAWLRRSRVSAEDIDDLVQEAYCKLAELESFAHIEEPGRYFFRIVRNLLGAQLRRAKIVQFETMAEIDAVLVEPEERSPEQTLITTLDLARLRRLIGRLPDRCRRILTLRKLEDVPQREIARRLGITESVVENDGVKGMRLLMQALREDNDGAHHGREKGNEPQAIRK